eukprot:4412320-Amphidinium_carterae.1
MKQRRTPQVTTPQEFISINFVSLDCQCVLVPVDCAVSYNCFDTSELGEEIATNAGQPWTPTL